MDELEHITILTGSSRISARSECSAATIDRVRAGIAATGEVGAGWSVHLWPSKVDAIWMYTLSHDGHAVVNCILCASAADSDAVWVMASRLGSLPGTRLHPPARVPWLAAGLINDPVIMDHPEDFADVLQEAGDLERIVAWALMA